MAQTTFQTTGEPSACRQPDIRLYSPTRGAEAFAAEGRLDEPPK
jgi:hypothetical protein